MFRHMTWGPLLVSSPRPCDCWGEDQGKPSWSMRKGHGWGSLFALTFHGVTCILWRAPDAAACPREGAPCPPTPAPHPTLLGLPSLTPHSEKILYVFWSHSDIRKVIFRDVNRPAQTKSKTSICLPSLHPSYATLRSGSSRDTGTVTLCNKVSHTGWLINHRNLCLRVVGVGGLSQGARTGWFFCAVGDHLLVMSWEDGEQGQEASFLVTLLTARIPS